MAGRLVAFDFDGTLTHTDSSRRFAALLDSGTLRGRSFLIEIALAAARIPLITHQQLKRLYSRLMFTPLDDSQIQQAARRFATTGLDDLVDPSMVQRLRRHCRDGDQVYIVSANFRVLLEPLREIWPLDGIIATEIESGSRGPTGALAGPACHGSEKLARVREAFGEEALDEAIAYGDSRNDLPLLRRVNAGFLVCRNGAGETRLKRVNREEMSQ